MLLPERWTRERCIDELAYRGAAGGLTPMQLLKSHEEMGITRQEFVELVNTVEFRRRLEQYIWLYCWYPRCRDIVQTRMNHAEFGNDKAREEVFSAYMGEGRSSIRMSASLEVGGNELTRRVEELFTRRLFRSGGGEGGVEGASEVMVRGGVDEEVVREGIEGGGGVGDVGGRGGSLFGT